jgi:hypothetical protein
MKAVRRGTMAITLAVLGLCLVGAGPSGAAAHHKKPAHHARKATVASNTTATPTTAKADSSSRLTQGGHGTFWECPAKSTSLLIGVNSLDLHPGQNLNIDFIVRNGGTAGCNYVAPYVGSAPGPTATSLQIGPCGEMGFEIEGAHNRNVWPGTEPFNCPALGFAQLAPSGAVAGAGSWDQMLPGRPARVPSGTYTLLVDGRFAFTLHIDAH